MGIKFTEKQLKEMLNKNKKLKISSVIGGDKPLSNEIFNANKDIVELDKKISIKEKKQKTKKISLNESSLVENENIAKEKSKSAGVKVSDLNKINKSSLCSYSNSNEHVSLLFNGAKLLSVNQIFAILQYRKYEIFAYKKIWHEIIKNSLDFQHYELKQQNKELPFFEDSVEITLFRQASRLVDEDAMSTMFKYIIDGLKRDPIKNPHGILAEDNPKIVHRIVCFSEKGIPAVGIKIKKIIEKKQKFSMQDILEI